MILKIYIFNVYVVHEEIQIIFKELQKNVNHKN